MVPGNRLQARREMLKDSCLPSSGTSEADSRSLPKGLWAGTILDTGGGQVVAGSE